MVKSNYHKEAYYYGKKGKTTSTQSSNDRGQAQHHPGTAGGIRHP